MRRTRRAPANTLAIPTALPTSGTIEVSSRKRFKRESEQDSYANIRMARGSELILASELRKEWSALLLETHGGTAEADYDDMSHEARRLHAEAIMPNKPPMYLAACCDSEAAQQLLTSVLHDTIQAQRWQELWVILGQIGFMIENISSIGSGGVLPWWVQQTRDPNTDVVEHIDLAAREQPGRAENPLDADTADVELQSTEIRKPSSAHNLETATDSTQRSERKSKVEMDDEAAKEVGKSLASSVGTLPVLRSKPRPRIKQTASRSTGGRPQLSPAAQAERQQSFTPNWTVAGLRDLGMDDERSAPDWTRQLIGQRLAVVYAEEKVDDGMSIEASGVLQGVQLQIRADGSGEIVRTGPDQHKQLYDFDGDLLLGTFRCGAIRERAEHGNLVVRLYLRPGDHFGEEMQDGDTCPYLWSSTAETPDYAEPYASFKNGGEVEFTIEGQTDCWPCSDDWPRPSSKQQAMLLDKTAGFPTGGCYVAHAHLATPDLFWKLYLCPEAKFDASYTALRSRFPGLPAYTSAASS